MTPSFDKTGRMLAPEPTRNVTRSVSFKLGLPGWSSIDFFSSSGAQVPESQAAEMSEFLYRTCYAEVEQAVKDYKARMNADAQEVLYPDPPAPAPKQEERNPFTVSARPTEPVSSLDTPEIAKSVPSAMAPVSQLDTPGTNGDNAGNAGNAGSSQESQADPAKALLAEVVDSKLADPPATPARRGRPAKAKPETVSNVDTTQGFKADDSDLPKGLGGTSEDSPGPDMQARNEAIRADLSKEAAKAAAPATGPQLVQPQLGQIERIKAAVAKLATGRDEKVVDDKVRQFVRGFLNIEPSKPLPRPSATGEPSTEAYQFVVPILESLVAQGTGEILVTPRETGLAAGVAWLKLLKHTEKWRADIKEATLRLAISRYPDNGMDLLDFLHNVAKLGNLDDELLIFLRTMRRFNAAIAMALKESSAQRGKTMASTLAGLDLGSCTEGEVLSRISGVTAKTEPSEELWKE